MTDAERLAAAFKGGGRIESLNAPPATVEEGYDIQDAMRAALDKPVVGWKVAAATPKGQAALGVDAPTVAPLLEGMIVPADTVFAAGSFYAPEFEAEIAIELASPLSGDITPEDVRVAASGFRLAIEVADTRYVDKRAQSPASVIADLNASGALVVGQLQDMQLLRTAAKAEVSGRIGDGNLVEPMPADNRPDPLAVVAFLARFLHGRGQSLAAGAILTTGTHVVPTPSPPGAIGANFVNVGRIGARLSEPRP
ncbi:MAG: fumarylacetoacetate hydrolase family protein [Pseudomonadota bacterium]